MSRTQSYLWFAAALLAYAVSAPARAVDGRDQGTLPSPGVAPSALSDIDNARAALLKKGIQLQLIYFGELLGNPTGGVRQGAIYDGRLGFLVDADLEKILGWNGATFHFSVHQIHGSGLSANNLDSLLVVSGIEALPAT